MAISTSLSTRSPFDTKLTLYETNWQRSSLVMTLMIVSCEIETMDIVTTEAKDLCSN